MATPLVTGLTVAAAALAMRSVVTTIEAWALAGPRARAFYQGGFEPTMTRREAALILGVRESAAKGKVLEAHRRVMMANHPDAGGSAFLSTKINEAKALLLKGKSRARSVDLVSRGGALFPRRATARWDALRRRRRRERSDRCGRREEGVRTRAEGVRARAGQRTVDERER